MVRLTPEQYEEFQNALLSAYPRRPDMKRMLRFRLEVSLDEITERGTWRDEVFSLIEWAIAAGREEELIVKSQKYNSGNPDLRAFVLSVAASSVVEPGGNLEAIVLESVAFDNVEEWLSRMRRRMQTVCRIQTPREFGTGFLVAPDLVMTCYHVVDDVHGNPTLREGVKLRFDYKTDELGIERQTWQEYGLEEAWLANHSPINELDFALLRVKGRPGEELMRDSSGVSRSWINPKAKAINEGLPMLVIQHPETAPLKITGGSVKGRREAPVRLIHSANTLPGSSGSPCFTFNWEAVAIHQAGDTATGNRSVPFTAILERIPDNLLGGPQP